MVAIKKEIRTVKDYIKRRFPAANRAYRKIWPMKPNEFPSYVCMELTNTCNLRCVQCMYQGTTTGHYQASAGLMNVELAKKVLDQLEPYKCSVMLNGDGESSQHPKFHEIVRHASSLNLGRLFFNTNGNLLTPEFIDELVTYYKGDVSFSLDGFKESHEKIRRGSSYDKVFSHIEYLQKRIKETNSPIRIQTGYCNLTAPKAETLIDGACTNDYAQPDGEREEFVEYWVNKVDMVSVGEVYDKDYVVISDQMNRDGDRNKRVMCHVPYVTFVVRYNGSIVPCSNCFTLDEKEGEHILGDANTDTLKNIWDNSPNLNKLRDNTAQDRLDNSICEKCDRWNMYVEFPDETREDGVVIKRSGIFSNYSKS